MFRNRYIKTFEELQYLLLFRALTPYEKNDEYNEGIINRKKALELSGMEGVDSPRINDTIDKLELILSNNKVDLWTGSGKIHNELSDAGRKLRECIDEVSLVEKINNILEDLQNIKSNFYDYTKLYYELSIAAHLVTLNYILPKILKDFENKYENKIAFNLRAGSHDHIIRMVKQTEVNIGLVDLKVFPEVPSGITNKGICYKPKWKVIIKKDSQFLNKLKLKDKNTLTFIDLKEVPIAFRNNPERKATEKIMSKLNVIYRCDSIDNMKALVREDCCVSIVPEEIILEKEKNNEFIVYDFSGDLPEIEINVITKKSKILSKIEEELIGALVKNKTSK